MSTSQALAWSLPAGSGKLSDWMRMFAEAALSAKEEAPASDEALMNRFISGDEAAFNELFDRYAVPLARMLTRMVGSPQVAEDLLQATFLSVVRGRDRFRRGSLVRPWLYAVAANAARDHLRRARFEAATDEGALPPPESTPAEERDPALQKRLLSALGQLSTSLREAVVLSRLEGLSFAEVGQALGISEGAAKVRAHRGSERLRALLEDLR